MTTKYKVVQQRNMILDMFRKEWPHTLQAHDKKGATFSVVHPDYTERLVLHPAKVITLLRQCDYHSSDLLAPLFYHLSTIVSTSTGLPTGTSISSLSLSDIERLIVGRERLHAAQTAGGLFPPHMVGHPGDLVRSARCQLDLLSYWLHFAQPRLFEDISRPVERWGELCQRAKVEGINGYVGRRAEACDSCKVALQRHMLCVRQRIWGDMADYFGLNFD